MEPATPEVAQPTPEIPQTPEVKKNSHWITILAMALFVLASLGAVAFLYYQNQTLKKMLASYQSQPSPTATADPTVNWKTYVNTKHQYSLKYPQDWFSTDCNGIVKGLLLSPQGIPECATEPFYPIQFGIDINRKTIEQYLDSISKSGYRATPKENSPSGFQKYLIEKVDVAPGPERSVDLITSVRDGLFIMNVNDLRQENLANQILSTFKFLGADPSPSAKACTQEAKLCPDGSYVGREGPNCEFAPCPTP